MMRMVSPIDRGTSLIAAATSGLWTLTFTLHTGSDIPSGSAAQLRTGLVRDCITSANAEDRLSTIPLRRSGERISPVAAHSGDCLLSEPTDGVSRRPRHASMMSARPLPLTIAD